MEIQLEPRTDADIKAIIGKFADQGIEIKDALVWDGAELKPAWLDSEGEPIAGIYMGIPNHLYHQIKGISSSMLKTFVLNSPAHFEEAYVLKESVIEEEEVADPNRPDHFTAGDLIHALILEPWDVYDRYYRDHTDEDLKGSLRTATDIEAALKQANEPKAKAGEKKADKAARLDALNLGVLIYDIEKEKLAAKNPDKLPIKGEVWDKAHRTYHKMLEREEATKCIDHEYGLPELSIIVKDPEFGIWLRIRPDFLRTLPLIHDVAYPPLMTDVKSANCARPEVFQNDAGKFGYDIQQAFYEMVFSLLTGKELSGFSFIVAEYRLASIVEPCVLDDQSLSDARNCIRPQIARLMECYQNNTWGGYTSGGVSELTIRPFERLRRSAGLNGAHHE